MYGTTGHFGSRGPPAALFFYSRDRSRASIPTASGELERHPAGRRLWRHGKRYDAERGPAPILEASCWAHARRKFHELVDIVGGSAPHGATSCTADDLADRAGSGAAHRRSVRYRAQHQRSVARSAARRALGAKRAARSRRWKPGCVRTGASCRATQTSPGPVDYDGRPRTCTGSAGAIARTSPARHAGASHRAEPA
jgi:hypothetical protein